MFHLFLPDVVSLAARFHVCLKCHVATVVGDCAAMVVLGRSTRCSFRYRWATRSSSSFLPVHVSLLASHWNLLMLVGLMSSVVISRSIPAFFIINKANPICSLQHWQTGPSWSSSTASSSGWGSAQTAHMKSSPALDGICFPCALVVLVQLTQTTVALWLLWNQPVVIGASPIPAAS